MLKSVKTSLAVIAVSLTFIGSAQADINEDLKNICTIVKTDDKGELRKKIKMVSTDYGVKFRDVYDGVTCGGQSLIRTAMKNSAVETGTLMVKKLSKKMLIEAEADGKTLSAWAEAEGFNSSPIYAALNERI
ncbi:DUF3718 domain-containing protein [Alteromonadaceae bacterium M269]|nr:DUF3718 domain-containing protein [Alteromonadaceae bacterium M269]